MYGRNFFLFFIALLVIYVVAWMIQSTILLNHDVSWLMSASKRMVEGGSYTNDFFELNPPMILYVYIPAIYLVKTLSISTMLALRIWIFSLATCSLILCYFFLRTNPWLLICMAATFLILPIYEFGQRESILLMLMMPYLLLVSCRLEGARISSFYAFGIGIFSGFGFALKPYFLLTPILIELYFYIKKPKSYSFMRLEIIALLTVLLMYMLSIIVFHKDYLTLVVPLVSKFYYAGLHFSWLHIIGYFPVIYTGLVTLCYFMEHQNDLGKSLNQQKAVFFLAMISLLVVYLIGRTPWYYHALPMYSLSIILMVLLIQQWAARLNREKVLNNQYLSRPHYNLTAFSMLKNKENSRIEIGALFVLLFFVDQSVNFYSILNDVWLTVVFSLILILFFYQFPSRYPRKLGVQGDRANGWFITILFLFFVHTVVFILPIEYAMRLYSNAVTRKENAIPLVKFLQDNASHRTVYFFSTLPDSTYPFIDYADANSASRVSFLIWIAASWLPNLDKPHKYHTKTELFLMKLVIDDLLFKKPELVFIDTNSHADFLGYFLESQEFRTIWQSYRYRNTLALEGMYRYDVYERTTKIY